MNLRLGCLTDKGNHRSKNQDRIISRQCKIGNDILAITCVCDGIGSFKDSEIAADIVVRGIELWIEGIGKLYPKVMQPDELVEDLEFTIRELNEVVCDYRKEKHIDIGCTMSVLLLFNTKYYIFHVGDSRIYVVRDDLVPLTQDQVVVRAVNGKEKKLLANYIGKQEQLALCRLHGLVQEGDLFITCSDGLYKKMTYADVKDILQMSQRQQDLQKHCERLIKMVLERGEKDNISCSMIQIEKNALAWKGKRNAEISRNDETDF